MDTAVTGTPRVLLRIEGLVALIASVVAYQALGAPWTMFAVLLLLPDVSIAGYFAGPRVGAIFYNTIHTYTGPALLGAIGYAGIVPDACSLSLIWCAHIGMDRSLGLGLKFPHAFRATHLGDAGRVPKA